MIVSMHPYVAKRVVKLHTVSPNTHYFRTNTPQFQVHMVHLIGSNSDLLVVATEE